MSEKSKRPLLERRPTPDDEVEKRYRAQMENVARAVDSVFNGKKRGSERETGFVLLVFPYGETEFENRTNYISSGADRKDIVVMMKEMIRRFECQPGVSGTA